jgi:hypothetical protein
MDIKRPIKQELKTAIAANGDSDDGVSVRLAREALAEIERLEQRLATLIAPLPVSQNPFDLQTKALEHIADELRQLKEQGRALAGPFPKQYRGEVIAPLGDGPQEPEREPKHEAPDFANRYLVGLRGSYVTYLRPIPASLDTREALNLAAYLYAMACNASEEKAPEKYFEDLVTGIRSM